MGGHRPCFQSGPEDVDDNRASHLGFHVASFQDLGGITARPFEGPSTRDWAPGVTRPDQEEYTAGTLWCAPGGPAIVGEPAFRVLDAKAVLRTALHGGGRSPLRPGRNDRWRILLAGLARRNQRDSPAARQVQQSSVWNAAGRSARACPPPWSAGMTAVTRVPAGCLSNGMLTDSLAARASRPEAEGSRSVVRRLVAPLSLKESSDPVGVLDAPSAHQFGGRDESL